jgi:hypothetical protein
VPPQQLKVPRADILRYDFAMDMLDVKTAALQKLPAPPFDGAA